MDNMMNSNLTNVQVYESAPKSDENNMEALKQKEKRFKNLGIGCFLYAVFYTICVYHNASGITYPFFAGGTLYFFYYCTKKLEINSAKPNKLFLMAAILSAGALNCTTDSGILIFFNRLLMETLLCVLLLQTWHEIADWSIAMHIKAIAYMVGGTICRAFDPFADYLAVKKLNRLEKTEKKDHTDRNRRGCAIAIGIVISMPIVLLIVILLASADAVFYELLCDIFTFTIDLEILENIGEIIKVVVRIALVFIIAYGIFSYNTNPDSIKSVDNMAIEKKTNWDAYIAVTMNAIICIIYVIFSGIQIFGLFLGKMTLPEGYTYASYARKGFFELVFVCLFNIALVLCTLAYFESMRILKGILTIICACTYIMAASSAFRMFLYIESYQLTFLRVFVLWSLLMIAILMIGVLKCIYTPKFRLFRYILVSITIGWLCFSALHPDYWIAKYNISQWAEGIDEYYLRHYLSLDAIPAIADSMFMEDVFDEYSGYSSRLDKYEEDTEGIAGFRYFNFSREYARNKRR